MERRCDECGGGTGHGVDTALWTALRTLVCPPLSAGALLREVDHMEGGEDAHHHAERKWTLSSAGHHERPLPQVEGEICGWGGV